MIDSFLSPAKSGNEDNLTEVRMFTADKLDSEIAKEKWDLIKVVCSQPFNKNLKYGLTFICIHSEDEANEMKQLSALQLKCLYCDLEQPTRFKY